MPSSTYKSPEAELLLSRATQSVKLVVLVTAVVFSGVCIGMMLPPR